MNLNYNPWKIKFSSSSSSSLSLSLSLILTSPTLTATVVSDTFACQPEEEDICIRPHCMSADWLMRLTKS